MLLNVRLVGISYHNFIQIKLIQLFFVWRCAQREKEYFPERHTLYLNPSETASLSLLPLDLENTITKRCVRGQRRSSTCSSDALSNWIWTLCGNTINMPILENICRKWQLKNFLFAWQHSANFQWVAITACCEVRLSADVREAID